jgi:cereblon
MLRLRDRGEKPAEAPSEGSAPADEAAHERWFLCKVCEAPIALEDDLIRPREGAAHGLFVNPHGVLHEVVTVRRAQGVDLVSEPTTEASWFPPYAWEIGVCRRCDNHLGWRFSASLPLPEFWGLRMAAVGLGTPRTRH